MICVWYMCIISNHITCTYSVLTYYVIFIIKGVNSDFCSPSLPCLRQWGSRGEPSLPLWLPRCNRIRRPSQDPLLETSEPKNSGAISKRAGVCWGNLSRSSFIICGPMSPKNKRAVKQSPWNSRPQQIQYCKRFNPQISWMKEPIFSERTFLKKTLGFWESTAKSTSHVKFVSIPPFYFQYTQNLSQTHLTKTLSPFPQAVPMKLHHQCCSEWPDTETFHDE